MSRKQKKDKLVLENLDRIVAGEKLQDQAGLDDETRKALELTRELSSWPKSPSKEFEMQLKAQITHRLAEQAKQESQGSKNPEFRDILHRPAWQLTVAAVILVVILAIITLVVLLVNRVL
jgi:hypothetical protein